MNRHPLSTCFPDISEDELMQLANDIKLNGQRLPGTLLDGMVLDGWHRYEACQIAGVKFKSVELHPNTDPVLFVISQNLERRHLTANQRAAAVVKCHAWKKEGRPTNKNSAFSAEFPSNELSAKELAEVAKTSARTIEYAKAAESAGKGDEVLAGKVTAKEAVAPSKPNPKSKPPSDQKLVARILELEADLEAANQTIDELREALSDYDVMKDEHERMSEILNADNKLKSAFDNIKQLSALNRNLNERIAGLQGERNMAIKAAKRASHTAGRKDQ